MRRHRAMRSSLVTLTVLVTLLAPSPGFAQESPEPVTRQHLLTLDDHASVYPDLRDPVRVVLRSPVFAPRGCEDRGQVVRGASRIAASVSAQGRRRSVSMIDQNVVRFASKKAARTLVRRYQRFSNRCVGNVRTDDGEGGAVTLKNRAWFPPRVGDQSAGMLIGWFSRGGVDWRRVLVVRVGRTVSVLDVSLSGVRPPRAGVVDLGELAVDRLR